MIRLGAALITTGWLLTAGVALAADSLPLAREVASSANRLESLRRQIGAVRGELDVLAEQHDDADRALGQATREIGLVKELLAGLDQRERILVMQRDSLQVDLAAQQETFALRQRNLAARLRAIAKQGQQRDLELILTAESFSALVARMKFSAMLTRLDGTLVEQTRRQGLRIQAEQQQLQAALAGIWEAREEARTERERLEMLEVERRALLSDLAREQQRVASELANLRRQAQDLENMLARLEAERQQQPARDLPSARGTPFDSRRGDLPWPATGSVVREFGSNVHPRFGTVTNHNGLSIAVTAGAPVQAVAPGRVEFADHLPGFGRCVILDHGSGHYTLYGNLARIFASRGSEVDAGQILAEMGEDAANGRPELYFEIREGRQARDPRQWLRTPR
jgi:murein hydrolase activator